MKRTDERMFWILQRIVSRKHNGIVAWDADVVDDFVDEFPEAEKTLIVYLMGPNSCPMLNRAAKRGERLGYLHAGSVGNINARSYNQRTWCRYWSITDLGLEAIKNNST